MLFFTAAKNYAARCAPGALAIFIAVAGCAQRDASTTQAPTTLADAATPTASPSPTPTPDPQAVAAWAHGRIIHDVPVRPGQKVYALTFDDGPWPESTRQILQVLDDYQIKATFFMVGQEIRARPEVARSVRDAGHVIGNHSWSHPSRPRDPVGEVQRTDAAIKNLLGVRPTIFRPPYGILKNGMARQAIKEGYPVFIWSADSADWNHKATVGSIASLIIKQATPGGIALMHDGGGDRHKTVEALPRIITELRAQGYRFVTIPELLKLRYIAPPKPKPTARPAKTKKKAGKP